MALLVQTPQDKAVVEGLKIQRKVYQDALQATVEALEFGELEDAKNGWQVRLVMSYKPFKANVCVIRV